MARTIVAIPTISQINSLENLVESVIDDKSVTDVIIYDNGHTEANKMIMREWRVNPKIILSDVAGKGIYAIWNIARSFAYLMGDTNLAILNDDIRIRPGTMDVLGSFLRADSSLAAVCPDYTMTLDGPKKLIKPRYIESTFGAGGLAGFCFMLKAELPIPPIDEQFQWWYGDDDLVQQIKRKGYKMARIDGVPVEHAHGSSSRLLDQVLLRQIIEEDRLHFNQKYGENRQI